MTIIMAKDNQPTIEELQKQLADERTAFELQLAKEKEEKERLAKAVEEATATGVVSPPVEGTFTVKGKDPETGNEVKKQFRFKNGRKRTPLRSGQQVPSAALIKLANGTKAEDIDCKLPWFLELTQELAQAELERLVDINAGTIEAA